MADTKNAFAALEKENSASWNTASRVAQLDIDNVVKGGKKETKNILDAIKDPKKQQAVESAFKETLNDIKSTVKLGKDPKREDFINAIKKAEGIEKVLNDALDAPKVILDHALIQILQDCVKIAAEALKDHKPGMVGAGAKAAKSKVASTISGVIGGMASQLTEGIPFAPEMLSFAGAKIKGFGGKGASSAQRDMAAKLQGGDIDETEGTEDAEENGGTSSPVEKAKEEILGGTTTGGGGDAGGGLEFTNELLINIDENIQWMRDNSETAESRRERLRDKGAEKVGGLVGKGKAEGIGLAGAGGGFMSDVLGDLAGSALGSFLGVKGLPKSFLTRVSMLRVLGALGPLLTNPYVLAAVAVGGLAWWLMGNISGGEGTLTQEEADKKVKEAHEYKHKSTKVLRDLKAHRISKDPTGFEAKQDERMKVYNAQDDYDTTGNIREGFGVKDGKIFKIGGILNKGKENGGVTTKTETKVVENQSKKKMFKAQLEQLDKRYNELIKEQELLPAGSKRRKEINDEIDALSERYNAIEAKIPKGKKGLKMPDWMPGIGKDQDIPTFLHLGEEVIEAEEIKALARITDIAKKLVKMYGKGAEYMFKDGGITYQAKGDKKTGEGSALQAIKLMTKFGISDFEHIWERDSKYGGDHIIDYGGGRVQMREDRDLMKNVMPGLIKQMKEINAAKLRLADISQSGVSIPFEVAMKNIRGAQLNQAASNKIDISGSGGGGFTNIDASTPVVNNTTTNIIPPIDTDGGRGRGLGISG